ncbi:MAG: PAS-domain containing protein [Rhodopseudomonas sp.]|uniref:PAS-domain containing protein n=1 Tax=Rhodopseudomonas sp. TaxID=1078 RepID=UPI0017EEAE01|nr:PAS-domain containing protein [Rhodopseudomonas sp.]NVN88098.1 PAS-domain containing protein [Rhodopseudomonas sp.]
MSGTEHSEARRHADAAREMSQRALAQMVSLSGSDENSFLVEALNETAIVAVTDVKGRILHANDKFCEISGYSREELIGQDHRILKSGVHPDQLFREMYRVIGNGRVWRGEFCNKAKSGRLYWVDTTIIPRRSMSGKVIGYTSIRIDISQRKQMEEALQRSEALNRSTMMALGEGIVVQDPTGAIVSFNPAAERILGLGGDDISGVTSVSRRWRAIREDGREFPEHEHPAMVTLATGEPQTDVVMGLRKQDDSVAWISINSVAIPGRDGRSVVTSFSDITERLRTKQILTESIAAIPEGFVVYDRDDRLIACNDAYRNIYSASASAIRVGATFEEILTCGLQNGQYPEAGDSVEQRAVWFAQRMVLHAGTASDLIQHLPNGRWVQIRERRTPSGYVVGFRADITEVKRETARLRAVIDNFPGGISLFDADLNLIACNESFRTLLDLPLSLFDRGLPTLEAIFRANAERGEYGPGEIDQQVLERIELAKRHEPHVFQRVRPNGKVLEICGIPVSGGGFISTYVDITDRHAAERLLAESEQRAREQSASLQVTLAHMSQGLSMFDGQDRLIVWNQKFAEIYGLTQELLKQGTPAKAISAHLPSVGFVETDQPNWRRMIAAGHELTARLRGRDGRVIEVIYTPVSGSGWVATHEDITDRVLSQKKLTRQAEELARINMQLDAALANMSQGLCLLDRNGCLVLTNKYFREMYGFSERQMRRGLPVRQLVESYAEKFSTPGFTVSEFVDAIPNQETRVLQLSDGRVIQIRRAPTPDGGWVATHEDITDRERSAQQVSYLAFHDLLTGLANRTVFNKKVEEALADRGDGLNVLLIDLDRFKSVNDCFGHAAGDHLLKLVAGRMSKLVRNGDLVARVGGDEFAILQRPTENQREAAISLSARLVEALAQPYDLNGRRALIGTSIGVAMRADPDESMEGLVHRADLALYEVKSSGRNGYLIYDEALGGRAQERLVLENDLRKAIAAGELELHYQPIVTLGSRQLCGMEALIRWRHPTEGMLSPDRFIQLAEETGLIVPLGEFVVRQACKDASNWPAHIRVAVNISPTHIKRRSLLDTVADALLQTGLEADRFEIEVTETVLMQHDEDVLSELHQLRSLGISVALDDFGTGFSSLSHLRMFSFDKIKIDRSFVAEITERSDSAAIVCAVTGLARALDIVTTAEGIESEQQLQLLLSAGCTQGQGFLFGKPKPVCEFAAEDFGVRAIEMAGWRKRN